MGYLSFHAGTEGKVKRADIRKATGHTFRESEGRYKTHSNKEIDRSKTHLNIDAFIDGKKIETLVEERLERDYSGKRALRKDAVVVREIIAQPSADYFEGMNDEEKKARLEIFIGDSYSWFAEEFGAENVLGYSGHLDETNPHVHFAIMPMTQDGRVSQKDFFKGPSDLKRQHRQFREHMNNLGWGFSLENKNENAEGVDLDTYKNNAETIESQRAEITRQTRLMKENKGIQMLAVNELKTDYLPKYKKEVEHSVKERYDADLIAEKQRLREQNERILENERLAIVESQRRIDEKEEWLKKKAKKIQRQGKLAQKMRNMLKDVVNNGRGTDFQKQGILTYLDTGKKEPSAFMVDSNIQSVVKTQQIIDEIEQDDGLEL